MLRTCSRSRVRSSSRMRSTRSLFLPVFFRPRTARCSLSCATFILLSFSNSEAFCAHVARTKKEVFSFISRPRERGRTNLLGEIWCSTSTLSCECMACAPRTTHRALVMSSLFSRVLTSQFSLRCLQRKPRYF